MAYKFAAMTPATIKRKMPIEMRISGKVNPRRPCGIENESFIGRERESFQSYWSSNRFLEIARRNPREPASTAASLIFEKCLSSTSPASRWNRSRRYSTKHSSRENSSPIIDPRRDNSPCPKSRCAFLQSAPLLSRSPTARTRFFPWTWNKKYNPPQFRQSSEWQLSMIPTPQLMSFHREQVLKNARCLGSEMTFSCSEHLYLISFLNLIKRTF